MKVRVVAESNRHGLGAEVVDRRFDVKRAGGEAIGELDCVLEWKLREPLWTARGLEAAKPFLRRAVANQVRLRRVPELAFEYDRGVEHQDRVEQILREIEDERRARGQQDDEPGERSDGPDGAGRPGNDDQ